MTKIEKASELADGYFLAGDNIKAVFYSFLGLQSRATDWDVVRLAGAVRKCIGPEEALLVLETYNSKLREINYQLAIVDILIELGRKELALRIAENMSATEKAINLKCLINAVDLLYSEGQEIKATELLCSYFFLLVRQSWSLRESLRLVNRSKNSAELIAQMIHTAVDEWASLEEEAKEIAGSIGAIFKIEKILDVIGRWAGTESANFVHEVCRFCGANGLADATQKADLALQGGSQFSDHDLAKLMERSLADSKGFSFVRMGDGEGRFVAGLEEYPIIRARSEKIANRIWYWNSTSRPSSDFFALLHRAYLTATVVGLNPASRVRFEASHDPLGYIGVVNGNSFILRYSQNSRYVANWSHITLDKRGVFEALVKQASDAGKRVNLISPYSKFSDSRRAFLLSPNLRALVIPSEGHALMKATSITDPHYPNVFNNVRKIISECRGELFLVAAGVFAKIYCMDAMEGGNVAIDIGSLMDQWMGKATR